MGLFREENHTIIVNPEIKALPTFKKIFTRDRNKYKRYAERDFLYIYHMYDYQSPYTLYPEREKKELIVKELGYDKGWEPDADLLIAIETYQQLNTTPAVRTLTEIRETLHTSNNIIRALREEIEDKLQVEDKDIDDLVDKLDKLLKLSEKVPKTISNIEQVSDQIIKEQSKGNRIKGGGKANVFET